jgi:hypothetical protein
LTPSTTKHSFHAKRVKKVFGYSKLETITKIGIVKSAVKMITSTDSAVRDLINKKPMEKSLKSIANSLRINWATTLQEIEATKRRLMVEPSKELLFIYLIVIKAIVNFSLVNNPYAGLPRKYEISFKSESKHPNLVIRKYLTSKTADQIGYKRKVLKIVNNTQVFRRVEGRESRGRVGSC